MGYKKAKNGKKYRKNAEFLVSLHPHIKYYGYNRRTH